MAPRLRHSGRREFLRALAGTAVLAVPRLSFAQTGPSVTPLGARLRLITGAGNNVIALAGDTGSLLVDSGDAAHVRDLLQGAGTVSAVFNTHYHLESTGGNDAMAAAGAKIVAHLNTKLWMTQEIIRDWEHGKVYPPRAKAALPTETFRAPAGEMTFGGEKIEYGLLTQAHTDGDIFVHFRNANVLAVGDVVQPGRLPALDWFCGGWIGGMMNAQKALLDRADGQTKIVPASGPVMTKADLAATHATIVKIREKLVALLKKGQGAQNMIDAGAVDEFKDVMPGDAATFLYCAYRGLWAHARELGGIV
ncbi:MAG TPA: MBL fold metallo-hydrolase [Vicinamibacterales bacterium]|nr:MBL fold metallo-hydrolase [Vicinamibacterales bacterium]